MGRRGVGGGGLGELLGPLLTPLLSPLGWNLQIFTSLALFNILISPLNAFPWVINGLMEAWVSTKRVNVFLQLEELNLSDYYCQNPASPPSRSRPSDVSSEEVPASREGAVNISELSYHYFSPCGSVSGAAGVHAVSIHGGCFTWSTGSEGGEDSNRGGEDESGDGSRPDTRSTASVGGDKQASMRGSSEEANKGECGHPQTAAAEGVKLRWGLTNINITIKPVSSIQLH